MMLRSAVLPLVALATLSAQTISWAIDPLPLPEPEPAPLAVDEATRPPAEELPLPAPSQSTGRTAAEWPQPARLPAHPQEGVRRLNSSR